MLFKGERMSHNCVGRESDSSVERRYSPYPPRRDSLNDTIMWWLGLRRDGLNIINCVLQLPTHEDI